MTNLWFGLNESHIIQYLTEFGLNKLPISSFHILVAQERQMCLWPVKTYTLEGNKVVDKVMETKTFALVSDQLHIEPIVSQHRVSVFSCPSTF